MGKLLVLVLSCGVLCVLGQSLCDDFPCCQMESSTDNCSLANMPASPSTLVYPGGKTRCIYTSSGAYAFQVWPGASDHLVINFQGGGACWSKQSTSGSFCTLAVSPEPEIGAFDRTNSENQFTKYTIVYVNYCSGDMHAGNVTRSYNDPSGNPIQQTGIYNVEAVLKWIENQQNMGQLAKKFEKFVIMGDSAGSIATQAWSFHLLQRFSYKKAAVIPDSYIGVFPPNTQGPLIYDFGACNSSILPPSLYSKCAAQELTLQDIVLYTLPLFPDIPFAYLQSKTDAVQISFYVALAASLGKKPYISQSQFYSESNEIMEMYNQYDNFVVFLVDGSHHTFTPQTIYYTAGTLGSDQGSGPNFPTVVDFVNTVPFTTQNEAISSECEGEEYGEGDSEEPKGNTYCNSGVYPKTFSQ